MLRTRTQRFFAALFVVLLGTGAGYEYFTRDFIHPTVWQYYMVNGESFDAESPTGKLIIDFFRPDGTNYQKYCPESVSTRAEWRGVWICDPLHLTDGEFSARFVYFKARVDNDYDRYWSEIADAILLGFMVGAAAWLAVLLLWFEL